MKRQLGWILLVLFVLSLASPSFAYERRHSPFFCFAGSDDRGETDFDQPSDGIRNRSEGGNWRKRKLFCPVLVDDSLPLSRIRTLTIQVYDGDAGGEGTVGARACVTYRWAVGGQCGAEVVDGFPDATGLRALEFRFDTMGDPLQKWRDLNVDFPYVEITLPGKGGQGFSAVLGYIVTD